MRIVFSMLIIAFLLLGIAVADDAINFKVEIPQSYKTVKPGDELLTSIKIINLAQATRVDVILDYWFTDSSGGTILKTKETVAVETQANFVRPFKLPDELKSGTYSFHSKVTYADGKTAESQETFEIATQTNYWALYYVLVGVSIAIILSVFYFGSFKVFLRKRNLEMKISSI
ncbi:MAG: hypothetical protein AABX51_01530, partial [Nanoarchaeota archaeon]